MENKIAFIENKDLGRYLQSLDSVRFNESDELGCKIQAKFEVIASLMLGRTIPIGEHQFIDSYGLLSNTYDLITALESLPESDRMQVVHLFPFQLFLRSDYKTLDGLIATKLSDPNYKLSLWRKLGQPENEEMIQRRKDIGQRIRDGLFQYEDDDLVPKEDLVAARMLHAVRDQFVQGEKEQVFTLYGAKTVGLTQYNGLLEAGINRICSWDEGYLVFQLEQQNEMVKRGIVSTRLLEEDSLPQAIELIQALKKLRIAGLQFNNRSHIRIGKAKEESGKDTDIKFCDFLENEPEYDGVLEIFDSLYNSSLAKAGFAHSESICTARDINENTYIRAAIALSTMAKNEITDQADLVGDYFNPPWIQNFSFRLNKSTQTDKMIEAMPWKHVWEAYLNPAWRNSVSYLNSVLMKWDDLINNPTTSEQAYIDITHELDDAYNRHIENVSTILAPSGWNFQKDQKTNKVIIQFLPWLGGTLAQVATHLAIEQVSIDPFWEESIPITIGAGVGHGIKDAIDPIGKWVTKGYIRKTFARLIRIG